MKEETIRIACRVETKEKWFRMPDTFPDFLEVVSLQEKRENELAIDSMEDALRKQLSSLPMGIRGKKWARQILETCRDFLAGDSILGLRQVMSPSEIKDFLAELIVFLRHVRKFSPDMRADGIGQAARNYVVFMMFGEIHQTRSTFCEACFAYSMLYPFTDNYIDRNDISAEEKREYNRLISDKIRGEDVRTRDAYQKKTFALLSMIEAKYGRRSDSPIYSMLLMMLEAQEESMRVQEKREELSFEDRLGISIYKGGISVLIDRYFVDKEMTEEDVSFYFSFGFFLQLADDLQDISEDLENGNQTVFTLDPTYESKERTTNRMFHYIHQLTLEYSVGKDAFLAFLLTQCNMLLCFSIFQSREYFSSAYLEKIEGALAVSASFLERKDIYFLEKADDGAQQRYLHILDVFLRSVTP